jgi:hypothetical protein
MQQAIKAGDADRFQLALATSVDQPYDQEYQLGKEVETGWLLAAELSAKLRLRVNYKATIESDTFETAALAGLSDWSPSKGKGIEDRLPDLKDSRRLVVAAVVDYLGTIDDERARDALRTVEKNLSEGRFDKGTDTTELASPLGVLKSSLLAAYQAQGMGVPESLKDEDAANDTEAEDADPEESSAGTRPDAFQMEGGYVVGPCVVSKAPLVKR